MSIPKELLDILVCPLSRQKLTLAGAARRDEVLEGVRTGRLKTRGAIDWRPEDVTELLVTPDGDVAYPVVEGVPNLLPASCILVKP